ncbi:MAG: hypothetical protein DRN29_09555 [Thermoplasmata archaeon]|nr:MAG: hypothetical protein DRN29_09555 [Thermoplasmata archaeon]
MKIQRIISEAYDQIYKIRHNLAHLYKFLIFVTPFLTVAFYFAFVLDYLPPEAAAKYGGLTLAYFIPPAGKESIIPLMLTENSFGPPLPAWVVGSTIVIMDVISSAILAYNWWFAELIIFHVPLLDRAYRGLQRRAEKFKKRRLLTVSLLLFMIIPFQGTGGISTTIIARLLGVRAKKTVMIVLTGSIITTTIWILWWLGFLNFLKTIF